MPEYLYRCQACKSDFSIIKRVADYDNDESCTKCGEEKAERQINRVNIDKTSAAQPYFEPALGCIIKSKGHKARILKERGLEEIGNTSTDTMFKDLEGQREKRMAKEWDAL